MCDILHSQNMQISTVDVIRCVKPSSHHKLSQHLRGIREEVGSFSLPEGLFQGAAKHHLHGRRCLAYIFERQSQKSTLLAICSDTPAQLQSDKCVHVVPPFRPKFLSTAFKQWRSSVMEIIIIIKYLYSAQSTTCPWRFTSQRYLES